MRVSPCCARAVRTGEGPWGRRWARACDPADQSWAASRGRAEKGEDSSVSCAKPDFGGGGSTERPEGC